MDSYKNEVQKLTARERREYAMEMGLIDRWGRLYLDIAEMKTNHKR